MNANFQRKYLTANVKYSGDLNSELVQYTYGPKQFALRIAGYSGHGLNNELARYYSYFPPFGPCSI